MTYDPDEYPEGHSPFCHRSCDHPCHDKYDQEVKKRDEHLMNTEDYANHCKDKKLDPEDPESLEIFKNFVIDHGGSLEYCA